MSKSAKTLSNHQVNAVLNHLDTATRNSTRNKVIFLLSVKAGLRAKEIASLKWSMVLTPTGEVSNTIHLTDKASKGKSGRIIPTNKELKKALTKLLDEVNANSESYVIATERSKSTSAQAVVNFFSKLYRDIGFVGCSSHSGRRTFVTNCAKKIGSVGGSLRDVQLLVGHKNLQTTQRYIQYDTDAQQKIVEII